MVIRRGLSLLLALIFTLGLLVTLGPVPSGYAQLEDLIARSKSAVALITVTDALGRHGRGSGFVYDSSGFILTDHHVIEGATDISVTLPARGSFPAKVVDYIREEEYEGAQLSRDVDAAILKINGVGLPSLFLGNSETLRQGQDLVVLGYPGMVGVEEVSATRGIVSAVRRGWIQTDAAIEPGDSGGPVLDRQGRVVGLATFVTGPLRKIGGVVAISNIRDWIDSALSPSFRPRREVQITGMEYQSPLIVPKRKVYRRTYTPGRTTASAYTREWTSDISNLNNINGLVTYTIRTSLGEEYDYYFSSDGAFLIGSRANGWIYSFPDGLLTFPLPPLVGQPWRQRWSGENGAQGIRLQGAGEAVIESTGETVTVPAGTFSQSIRAVRQFQVTYLQSNGARIVRTVSGTAWLVPKVGLARTMQDVAETGERIVDELVSMEY